jgi:hypothetical protein
MHSGPKMDMVPIKATWRHPPGMARVLLSAPMRPGRGTLSRDALLSGDKPRDEFRSFSRA